MNEPRFYVVALLGYSSLVHAKQETLTASVLDRVYCHREVARFGQLRSGGRTGVRGMPTRAEDRAFVRDSADAEAARLNAEHDAWLAAA